MNCPHCNKNIFGLTGLQELKKFHKHLPKCRKNPANKKVVTPDGELIQIKDRSTMMDALNIRHESGQ